MKTKLLIPIIVLCATLFISCSKDTSVDRPVINGFTIFTIDSGRNECTGQRNYSVKDTTLTFDFYLFSNAYYPSYLDRFWCKVYGMSNGYHMNNSCRLGWRCQGDSFIVLGYYLHVNGAIVSGPMDTIRANQICRCNITFSDSVGSVDSAVWKITIFNGPKVRTKSIKTKQRWLNSSNLLLPYFGGDSTALRTINIGIKQYWSNL